jgi:4-amino-4-deoxy-L-arabinose transferase-like glycosyltransferase
VSQTARRLVLILAIALVIRGSFAIGAWLVTNDSSAFHVPDTGTYLAPARDLLAHGTFTRDGRPELARTPGYPLLLVPGIWLGRLEATTITLQIVLSVLTVIGVFTLGQRVFNDRPVALIAAGLYAVEPLSTIYTAILATETLFTAVVVWSLVLIVAYVRRGRPTTLVGGMALLAAGVYVRPAGYFLPLCLIALLGGYAVWERRWSALRHLAIAAASAAAVVAPWQLRNRALGFAGISSISSENLYFYNAASLRAERTHTSLEATQAAMGYHNDSVYLALHPDQRIWRPGERFQFMADEGTREIRADVVRYARVHLAGMALVLLSPGTHEVLRLYGLPPVHGGFRERIAAEGPGKGLQHLWQSNAIALVVLGVLGLGLIALYALACRGLTVGGHWRDFATMPLVVSVAYFVVIAGGPVGESRFRHPLMPLICVLAAAGLRRESRQSAGPLSQMGSTHAAVQPVTSRA